MLVVILIAVVLVRCEVPLSERALLLDICASTNIEDYNSNVDHANWCTDADVCNWGGVTCNFAGTSVTSLTLIGGESEYISGSLPASFAALPNLESLFLKDLATTGVFGESFVTSNAVLNLLALSGLPVAGFFSFDYFPASMRSVLISNTQISGTLAGDLTRFAGLFDTLTISGPLLDGEIPMAIFSIFESSTGTSIKITNTLIGGEIPETLCATTARNVDLSNNRFTERPTCLTEVVGDCDLRGNRFCTGPVPEDGVCSVDNPPIGVTDQCFVCSGNGQSCTDCAGTPFGTLTYDVCEVCGGSTMIINDCPADCTGTPNGQSVYDACDVCGGDASTCKDCSGVVNGPAAYDVCDVCAGSGTTCVDCNGVLLGTSSYDACDVCNGDGSSCLDCNGAANGPAVYDQCDVCDGGNISCADCSGVPYGTLKYDRCDVCGGDDTLCGLEFVVANSRVNTVLMITVFAFIIIMLPICFLCYMFQTSRKNRNKL